MQDWPVPKSVHDVQRFLGLANYFRRFIHAYASIARPMQKLVRKETKWNKTTWTTECQTAFELLKKKLTEAPVLAMPDFTQPFKVIADASKEATGAILMQNGKPLAFESKRLTPAELNYGVGDQELVAVIHALLIWRCYLDGSVFGGAPPPRLTLSVNNVGRLCSVRAGQGTAASQT